MCSSRAPCMVRARCAHAGAKGLARRGSDDGNLRARLRIRADDGYLRRDHWAQRRVTCSSARFIIVTAAVFVATLVPGLLAVAMIAFLVQEKERAPVAAHFVRRTSCDRCRSLPQFLVAVGLFGAGEFAHTLLILLATQKLAPLFGAPRARQYRCRALCLAQCFLCRVLLSRGWLADRFPKNWLLSASVTRSRPLMTLSIILLPARLWTMALVFVLGGIQVGVEETLEDSFCAELVDEAHHGMAFGVLATVNGVGDFLSSIIVGALWSGVGVRSHLATARFSLLPAPFSLRA